MNRSWPWYVAQLISLAAIVGIGCFAITLMALISPERLPQ